MFTATAPAIALHATEPCPTCRTTSHFGPMVTSRITGAQNVDRAFWQYHAILTCSAGHDHRRMVARWFDGDAEPTMYEQGELRGGSTNTWGMTIRSRAAVRREAAKPVTHETCGWDDCRIWTPGGGLCRRHERALGL